MAFKLPRPPKISLPNINHRLTAALSFGVICAGALISIQLLGDPAAAGPRSVVSLNPSAAAAEAAKS